ncbi:MAG: hypothetical protein JNM93_08155 [Bacteriovoracaceae bacterium]|nr:hypothetical protein [Bacteriovoracaceae bacterium]
MMKIVLLALLLNSTLAFSNEINEVQFEEFKTELERESAELPPEERAAVYDIIDSLDATVMNNKQSGLGKILSKVGLFLGKIHTLTTKPFVNISAFITGFLEKTFKTKPKKTKALVQDWSLQVEEYAKKNQISELENLIKKVQSDQKLTAAEIDRLLFLAPEYRLRLSEVITGNAMKYVAPTILIGLIKKSWAKVYLGATIVVDAAYLIALAPCLKSENKNPNTQKYCVEMVEHYHTQIMNARIRGYLKGSKKKNKD